MSVRWEDPRLSLPAPAPPAPSKSAGNPFASSSGSQPTSSTQTANVSLGSSFADRFSEHPTPTPLLQAQSLANSAGSRAPSPSQKTSAPANTSREQDDDLPPPYDDGVPLSNPQPSINSRGPSPSQPSSHAPVPSSSNIPDDPLGPLPQGWIKIWDKASGKWYFVDERQRPPVITWGGLSELPSQRRGCERGSEQIALRARRANVASAASEFLSHDGPIFAYRVDHSIAAILAA